MTKYTVGQVVYTVSYRTNLLKARTVTKVGRKWLHLDTWEKVPITSKLWESPEAYEAHVALRQEWLSFASECGSTKFCPPETVTQEGIAAARKALGL